jgi:hypothetical protein
MAWGMMEEAMKGPARAQTTKPVAWMMSINAVVLRFYFILYFKIIDRIRQMKRK